MEKKVYSPTIFMQKVQLPVPEIGHIIAVKKDASAVAVRCPKCGHIHEVAAVETRHNRRSSAPVGRKFLCPACGHYTEATYDNEKFIGPEQAIVFKNEDGSMALSVIYTRIKFAYKTDQKPHCSVRKLRRKFVFSSNGQTYTLPLKYCRSNRQLKQKVELYMPKGPVIRYLNKEHIENSTFLLNPIFIENLRKNGVDIPVDPNIKNRFRNLSEKYIEEVKMLIGIRTSSTIRRIITAIRPEFQDMDLFLLMQRKMRSVMTKAIRRYVVEKPVNSWFAYQVFKWFGMKDINNLQKLMQIDMIRLFVQYVTNKIRTGFLFDAMRKLGETGLVNILTKYDYPIIQDTSRMYSRVYRYLPVAELMKMIRQNLRKTHDQLNYWDNLFRMSGNELNRILVYDRRAKEAIDETEASMYKQIAMAGAEEYLNHEIKYSEEEKKLESSHYGIDFILPAYTDEISNAGKVLHNCLNGYKINALHHDSNIVLMKENNKIVGAIEITQGQIRQAYGPCNNYLEGIYAAAYQEWASKNNFDTATDKFRPMLNHAPSKVVYDLNLYDAWIEQIKNVIAMKRNISYHSSPFDLALPF